MALGLGNARGLAAALVFFCAIRGQADISQMTSLAYHGNHRPRASNEVTPRTKRVFLVRRGSHRTLPGDASDIEATGNLTNTLMRQFELISNDETNLYESAIGSAFNASVTDFRTAQTALNKTTDANSCTFAGVQNSLTAMADDMLVAFASAQLMVGNLSQQNSIQVEVEAVQFGSRPFIITLLVLNLMLVAVVLGEVIRTAFWRGMPSFNYADLRHVIVAASTGGSGISGFVYGDGDNQEASVNDDVMHHVLGTTTVELKRYRGRPALVLIEPVNDLGYKIS